ncbi:efflux RND transporter permease subunit [Paremcibacter congregatus]|uniref:efflux RND transporter permease subunit n=1 Tax=Paremcibacter congregatus TaxID=2043170 RepID=UPI001055B441|nr:efflux RND transporter permease subunit [Paremcibacter congregatus]QDE27570.1 efflux RND transporter permease subunit [Paremcibacter congregatus]
MKKKIYNKFNPVNWMAQNHVAANLLMLLMLIGGIFFMQKIRQEIQPNYTFATVIVSMSYPGASPEEVEENIILAIEASLQSVEGLDRIRSTASEGFANVYVDIEGGENLDRVLQNVRNAVDIITSFPTDAERPNIRLDDDARWLTTIGISGDVPEKVLHDLVNRIKSDLLHMEGVIQVLPQINKDPEISIEIPQSVLRSLNVTLPEVAQRVGDAAKDVPSGDVETTDGQYILRTEGRREYGMEFKNIPLKTDSDGSQVTLGDVSTIRSGFEENTSFFSYNGAPGMIVYVYQSKNSRAMELANRVHQYVEDLSSTLPDTLKLDLPSKRTEKYSERMDMLIDNGMVGLLLVVLTLGLFLNPRLAFWVGVSIPVVFISSFSILYYLDVSINMISMFAFIMTLGIVVDDAIIVGESIHAKRQQGLSVRDAVVEGANDMILPVIFAVGTNIIAFIPLIMLPGDMGQYMKSLPIVAVVVFTVSLIEALFILPAHLNAKDKKRKWPNFLKPLQRTLLFREHVANGLDRFRDIKFRKALTWAIDHRYITVVLFTGGLILIAAWFESNRIDFHWYPQIPSDRVSAKLTMPADASFEDLITISENIEAAGVSAIQELGSLDDVESRSVSAGLYNSVYSSVTFELVSESHREFDQNDFVRLWREKAGDVPEAHSLVFDFLASFGGGSGVYVDMRHSSNVVLETAAKELAATMKTIEGLVDVTDGLAQGKKQLRYTLTDEATSLGFTENELGRQLRAAFFGAEAVRMLRDSHQVKVWVRLPVQERNSLNDLENFVVRSPSGVELPLSQATDIEYSRTFTDIRREDGRRNIYVGGVMDMAAGSESLAKRELTENILPALKAKYPGLQAGLRGSFSSRSGYSTMSMIGMGLGIVSVVVFALMASLFRSYLQGFIVIMTIPYCMAAAVAGHIIMGYGLTSNSMFGMIALAGMVVNGSLVLTSRMNDLIRTGIEYREAIIEGSISRFRPILITSLTTTVGLLPMLFETSQQALFLVPFAIALSFGTVVSSFVVLLLIPALHAIHYDFKAWKDAEVAELEVTAGVTKV